MQHHSINNQTRLQASAWISRLNRGLSDVEKPQLIAWINQDPKHHKAIYKVATFFDDISQIEELNGIFPLEQKPTFWNAKMMFAAFVILMIASFITYSTFYWLNPNQLNSSPQIFTTKLGESKSFELPDGSKMLLNTKSKVEVSYSETARLLNLVYGEAQFDVAKDRERPFSVISGSKSFTALGTIFNVQKDNESDMELIVSEGRVLIGDAQINVNQLAQTIENESQKFNSSVVVTAGKKARIENKQKKRIYSLNPSHIEQTLAWQKGMLVFNGETLKDVLMEVSRYTDVQFEIHSDEVSKLQIAGTYKTGDITGLLTSLENNFSINYKFNATNSVQLSK